MPPVLRTWTPADLPALLALWARCFPRDPLTADLWQRQVLDDPHFDPARLFVAELDGALAGLALALCPADRPGRGWVTALAVAPESRRQGLGTRLLDAALAAIRAAGGREVSFCDYVPHYFVPGVDEELHADGLAFLTRRGFQVTSRPLGLEAALPGDTGAADPRVGPADYAEVADAFSDWLPEAWRYHALQAERMLVARAGDQVVGYCQFAGERFGPLGVQAEHQHGGLGQALVRATLAAMSAAGRTRAYLLWTSDEVFERVYRKNGFRVSRRFAILRRGLEDER